MALLSRRHAGLVGVGALFVVAIAGIAYFEPGPRLAFNDDYIYSFSARHLAAAQLYLCG